MDGRLQWNQPRCDYQLEQEKSQPYLTGAYICPICGRRNAGSPSFSAGPRHRTECLLPETLLKWKHQVNSKIASKEKEIAALRRYIEINPAQLNDQVIKHLGRTMENMEKAVTSCRLTLQQFEISAEMLHVFERTLLTFRPEGGVNGS